MSKFGERLRIVLEKKELQGKELAKILNVEPPTVSNWLNSNRFPKDDMLINIADFFDCSVDYLLGRTDNPNSKVYSTNINGNEYSIEMDKSYPYDLEPDEISELILKLKEYRFDVEGLIQEIKGKK